MSKKKPKVGTVTSESLKGQIVEELGNEHPKIDSIVRFVGKLNRIEGRKMHRAIIQLIGKPDAQKRALELLDNDR